MPHEFVDACPMTLICGQLGVRSRNTTSWTTATEGFCATSSLEVLAHLPRSYDIEAEASPLSTSIFSAFRLRDCRYSTNKNAAHLPDMICQISIFNIQGGIEGQITALFSIAITRNSINVMVSESAIFNAWISGYFDNHGHRSSFKIVTPFVPFGRKLFVQEKIVIKAIIVFHLIKIIFPSKLMRSIFQAQSLSEFGAILN